MKSLVNYIKTALIFILIPKQKSFLKILPISSFLKIMYP